MERRLLTGPQIPDDLLKTSATLLEQAGRVPGGMGRLEEAALGSLDLNRSTRAFVFPKLRPYAPGPAFDHMVLVAKEGGTIGDMTDLTTPEFARLLGFGERILSTYERNTSRENPVVKEVLAINYHADPVADDTFQRKLRAQTLKDLHLHVVGFRASDVDALPELDTAHVSRDQISELREPLAFLVSKLSKLSAIEDLLSEGLTRLTKTDQSHVFGIEFEADADAPEDLAHDLAQLHKNMQRLYDHISDLFVERGEVDGSGMSIPLPPSVQERRIRSLFEAMGEDQPEAQRLMRSMIRLGRALQRGEAIQELSQEQETNTRVFLRGLAYTLAIVRDPKDSTIRVSASLRLLSTGNMLATLGYCKVTDGPPSESWIAAKEQHEEVLRNNLKAA